MQSRNPYEPPRAPDGARVVSTASCHAASLHVEDFGRRLVNWNDHGYMTPDGRVFDVGIQTSRALQVIRTRQIEITERIICTWYGRPVDMR